MKIGAMNRDQESRSSRVVSGNLREVSNENRERRRGDGSSSSFQDEEALSLHNLDHPGMTLVTLPLIDKSKSVKIALRAKNKLCFIDGMYTPPSSDSPLYGGLKKVDYMIFSWLLNSSYKDISKSFIYANSARDLRLEVEAQFGESNGLMIYQLQQEINATTQGNTYVTQYFFRLKKLWDE